MAVDILGQIIVYICFLPKKNDFCSELNTRTENGPLTTVTLVRKHHQSRGRRATTEDYILFFCVRE